MGLFVFWSKNLKDGNWIALDKNLIRTISQKRPYSYIEAMFSLTYDIDNSREGTINGYSKLWNWSRNKVRKFINELGTVKGHLADSKGTYKGHPIRLIKNNLEAVKDSKGTVKGHLVDSKRDTTIYPNPNPDKILEQKFNSFWTEYSKKVDKKKALNIWLKKIKPDNELFEKIMSSLKRTKLSKEWQKNGGEFIPHPTTWLNGERWNDEHEQGKVKYDEQSF